MPSVSDKEILVKIQVNTMVDYLVNTYKYTYANTYHRLLTSTLYLNQDPLYVLDDFKSEVMPRIS